MRWRPSATLQGLARAIVWAMVLPNAYIALLLATMGHAPPLRMIVEIALELGVLAITRPLLSTERARAEFAPLALRPWFLASAIGAMASGLALAKLAAAFSHFPELARDVAGLTMLAIPLFIAGLGVLRMRAWGVVLGALTALGSIPVVVWMHDSLLTIPVLLATVPAAMMGPLVAIARAAGKDDEAPHTARRCRVSNIDRVAAGSDPIALDVGVEHGDEHAESHAALHRG